MKVCERVIGHGWRQRAGQKLERKLLLFSVRPVTARMDLTSLLSVCSQSRGTGAAQSFSCSFRNEGGRNVTKLMCIAAVTER